MKIVVVGAGGVGGYFGTRLAAAGSDVTFVARGRHREAMLANGLRVISPRGNLHLPHVRVTEDIATISAADLIIVAVKLWDTESVAPALKPLVDRGAAVVSFQNGTLKDDILRRYLPADRVLGGVSYIASVIAEPGVIEHRGQLQRLVFGEFDGRPSEHVTTFLAACQAAEIDAEISSDISRAIWEKFVFLVGLSGATSSIRQPIGPIRTDSRTRTFLLDVMREVVNVGRARRIALPEGFAADRLAFMDTLPADMTSSMHHDLQRGNRLELQWLSGAVVDYGRELGVPTPCNRTIADVLTLYAQGRTANGDSHGS